ncbi:MAG: flavin-dependent dehydrogenase [Candidatus Omnitrophota bacterium]|jgi:flavin-dependent dehydrogenase
MPAPKFDPKGTVLISGAGPSGLAAAIYLKQHGIDVEIHEAKSTVGTRWRRGSQILENVSEKTDIIEEFKRLGIKINFNTSAVQNVTLWNGGETKANFESKLPLGYYVNRGNHPGDFDRGLYDQAVELGVNIIFGSRKKCEDVHIVATGPRRVDGIGKEITFSTQAEDRMTVMLDPELAPGGYAYLFIAKGHATIGMAILGRYKEIDTFFIKTIERFSHLEGVDIQRGGEANLYANFFLQKSGPSPVNFVGEAGGFQDYLFGFGMRYAVQSGTLAAKCLIEGKSFEKLSNQFLLKKQKISLWNRFFYERFQKWLPKYFINQAQKSGDIREYLGSWYHVNPAKIITSDIIRSIWSRRLTLDKKELYDTRSVNSK